MASQNPSISSTGSSLSPGCNEIDHIMSELLSTVATQDISFCTTCEEGREATSRCMDCSELLCDPCVRAHVLARLTKDHHIKRFASTAISKNIYSPINVVDSAGCSSGLSNSPCPAINTVCDIHREPHRLYCETCYLPTCAECAQSDHFDHKIAFLQDVLENATSFNYKLNKETRIAMGAVRDAKDNVEEMINRIERKYFCAKNDIKSFFERLEAAIKIREQELMNEGKQVAYLKASRLKDQSDRLATALDRLTRVADVLNNDHPDSSPLDMILANEKGANELKSIRSIQSELRPCEDDGVCFLVPDTTILRAICTMGAISYTSTSSAVAISRPPPRSPAPSPVMSIARRAPVPDSTTVVLPSPVGRPIFGLHRPCVVRDNGRVPSLMFGTEGEGEGEMCRPWGICCNRHGQFIVADRSNARIQVFDSRGNFLFMFGRQGCALGQFERPAGVAVTPSGNIVVADKDNHRIQIFKPNGVFLTAFGEKGSHNGQFNYPWDVACNSLGHILVSDTRNHRLQLFTADGVFIKKYGFENSSSLWKHFDSPRGVCFTPMGDAIVTDFNNHRLVIIDKDLTHAQFMGSEGSTCKHFLRPQGITCDDHGRVLVADSRNNRVQVFDSNGLFLFKVGQSGKGPGEFDRPSGICLTPQGGIAVVDFGNTRVQVF